MFQLNSNIQIMSSSSTPHQMLHTLEILKTSLKSTLKMFARISKLEWLENLGLHSEVSAEFSLQWMTEAVNWKKMISDGDLSILVFNFQKKNALNSAVNSVEVRLIMLISLMNLEEAATLKEWK
jgi:hypothetical protein